MKDNKVEENEEDPEEKTEFITPERKSSIFLLEYATEEVITTEDELKTDKPKELSGCRRYAGVILALLAGLSFTLSTLIVKALTDYHALSLSVWRFVGFIVPTIPMTLYYVFVKKEQIFSTIWPLTGKGGREKLKTLTYVWLSGVFGCTTFMLRFYSLMFLTLADATVIAFSGPVVSIILAHFFLSNERCGFVTIPIALWTLLGVFIIARPPVLTGESEFSDDTLIGIALALTSVLFVSMYFIIMRKLRHVHLAVISLVGGFWGVFQGLIVACSAGVFRFPEGAVDILLTASMAALSFMGQIFIVSALKWEQAGTVSLVRTSDVIFAFMWQLIFLDAIPDIFSYLGAVIVVIGVLLTTFRKWVSTLPEESTIRKMFGFLLK